MIDVLGFRERMWSCDWHKVLQMLASASQRLIRTVIISLLFVRSIIICFIFLVTSGSHESIAQKAPLPTAERLAIGFRTKDALPLSTRDAAFISISARALNERLARNVNCLAFASVGPPQISIEMRAAPDSELGKCLRAVDGIIRSLSVDSHELKTIAGNIAEELSADLNAERRSVYLLRNATLRSGLRRDTETSASQAFVSMTAEQVKNVSIDEYVKWLAISWPHDYVTYESASESALRVDSGLVVREPQRSFSAQGVRTVLIDDVPNAYPILALRFVARASEPDNKRLISMLCEGEASEHLFGQGGLIMCSFARLSVPELWMIITVDTQQKIDPDTRRLHQVRKWLHSKTSASFNKVNLILMVQRAEL